MSSIWNRLVNAATQLFGITPVANGGTGLASGTDGGVLGFTAAGTIASSGALTAAHVVLGGGAGATPTALAFGTANQVLGMNNGASAYEHKTMAVGSTGSDFAVANAANSITFNLPDAGASARGAVTTANQTFGGRKQAGNSKVSATMGNPQSIAASNVRSYLIIDTEGFDTNSEFGQVTAATTNLTCTSGNPSATVASATGVAAGQLITAANVPANTYVISISGTTVTMSRNANATNTSSATFGEYRFVPTVSGYYLATLSGSGMPISTGKWAQWEIYFNGTGGSRVAFARCVGDASNDDTEASVSVIVSMNGSTDYLICTAIQNDTANRAVNSGASFTRFTVTQLL